MKIMYFIILTTLLLSSCEQNSNKKVNLNEKFINICKTDIKMKLADLKELSDMNEMKYKSTYSETLEIQSKFDSIYSLIGENNFEINTIIKEISAYTKKHSRYKTRKKIELILNTDITAIDKKELLAILLELNSTIITELHYDIDLTNQKVNRIMAIAFPEKKEVKLGETFNTYVVIAAVDSMNPPFIKYRNQTIMMTTGIGNLQITAERKGINESTGIMYLKSSEEGFKLAFPFKFEFYVK